MKKLLLALALILAPSLAHSQCTGIFEPGFICSNPALVNAPPKPASLSSVLNASLPLLLYIPPGDQFVGLNGATLPSRLGVAWGSPGSPVTTAYIPEVLISRTEAITQDTQGAQNAPLQVWVDGTNLGLRTTDPQIPGTSMYGLVTQTNAARFDGNQFGIGDALGVWSQATQHGLPTRMQLPASAAFNSLEVEIAFSGDTNWVAMGAPNNNVGTIFTVTGAGSGTGTFLFAPITAPNTIEGIIYKIITVGSTDYTLCGSPNNTVGTIFRATSTCTGTGTSYQMQAFNSWASFSNAVIYPGTFAGYVSYESNTANASGVDDTWQGMNAGIRRVLGGYASASFDAVSNCCNRVGAAYMMRGVSASSNFDVGIGVSYASVKTATIIDNSSSDTVLLVKKPWPAVPTSHINGIDMSETTITGSFLKSTGNFFNVAGDGKLTITQNAAPNAQIKGIELANSVTSSNGNQSYSPYLLFRGQGWHTDAGGASDTVDWFIYNQPVQSGGPRPGANLQLASQMAGLGLNVRFEFLDAPWAGQTHFTMRGQFASVVNLLAGGLLGGQLYTDANTVFIIGSQIAIPLQFVTNGVNHFTIETSGVLTGSFTPASNTSTDGIVLVDPTAATNGNQQYSPRIRLRGQGWKTDAGGASQPADWIIENQPVQGTANVLSNLAISYQLNGGGYNAGIGMDVQNLRANFWGASVGLSSQQQIYMGGVVSMSRNTSTGLLRLETNSSDIQVAPNSGITQFGPDDAASPVAQTLQSQSVSTGTSNVAGVNRTVNASRGTGTGAGGNLIWQVAPAGGSGSSQNTFIQAMVIDSLGHIRVGNNTAPALTSCGGGSPAILGDDTAGEVTMGTTATGCVITFNKAYTSAPYCVVNWQATPLASQSWTVSTTAITTVQTSTSSNKLNYVCRARNGG